MLSLGGLKEEEKKRDEKEKGTIHHLNELESKIEDKKSETYPPLM
jgi:hypothetical protein